MLLPPKHVFLQFCFSKKKKHQTLYLVELYGMYLHGFFHSVLIVGLIWVACSCTEFFTNIILLGWPKSSFGFFVPCYRKTRTVWPTQYMTVPQFFHLLLMDIWVVPSSEYYIQCCCGHWYIYMSFGAHVYTFLCSLCLRAELLDHRPIR